MNTDHSEDRKSGVPLIGSVPWGTHFCQFYQAGEDLFNIIIPYFKAGLRNNEFCLWIVPDSFKDKEMPKALEKEISRFTKPGEKKQFEIISSRKWLQKDPLKSIISWFDHVVLSGFEGLRIVCNNSRECVLCEPGIIDRYNIIALSAFQRDDFDTVGLMETVKNYPFALILNNGRWELLKSSEAQLAKNALKRSEDKLRSLFSNMAEGHAYHRIVLDPKGEPCDYVFLQVNRSFQRLTQLKSKDVIGKKATQVLPGIEKDPANWIGKFGKVALTGKPVHFESYSQQLKRWYAVSAFSPHKGFFAVTFSDITEHKEMLQALKDSQQRYATTLTSIGDAVIAADREGNINFMNIIAEELTGWKLAQASGKPVTKVFRIINEFTRKPVPDPVENVLKSGMIIGLANHTLLIRKDGTEVPVDDSGAPIKNYKGEIVGAVLVFRDITERKKAEQKIAHLASFPEYNPNLVIEIDFSGKVTYVNPVAAEFLKDLGLDNPSTNPFIPKDLDIILNNLKRKDRLNLNREISIKGHVFLELISVLANFSAVRIYALDITERKKLEEKLKRYNEGLEELIKERTGQLLDTQNEMERARRLSDIGTLAATVAHELRNPLAAIGMAAYNIKKKANNPDIESHLMNINKKVAESDQIIGNLLFYSRLKPPNYERINIAKILEECSEVIEKKERKPFIVKHLDGISNDIIDADPVQIKEVFYNVLNNAYDAVPHKDGEIKITAKSDNGSVLISFEDNGSGIEKDIIGKIFDPFFTTKSKGTGLGLAVCRQIVTMHGGQIEAKHRPGKGANIFLRLPKRRKSNFR